MNSTTPPASVEREKPLPCPFCGSDVEIVRKNKIGVLLCPEASPCFGSGLGSFFQLDREVEAIAAWNTRASTPPSRPTREENVERVARAICAADPNVRWGDPEPVVQQRVDSEWKGFIPHARAAIHALGASA